jgi:muconate cycloisomerase
MKIDGNDPVRQPISTLSLPPYSSRQERRLPVNPKIEHVETFLVDLPTIRPHQLSMTTMKGQTLMIVRITTSDGVVGIGEGTTIGGLAYGAESPEGMKLTIDTYITPHLLTADPNRVGATMASVAKAVQGNHFAKCAVETALLDALGKRSGLSISDLLGGRFHDRLPIAWTLASGNTATDIAEAEEMLEKRRHRIFKLKIGRGEPKQNIAHVAAIKRALGDRASVRVDVNQAWSETTAAISIAALEDIGVDLVEQPIALSNRDGMARLSAGARVAIMADESLHGPETAFAFAAHAAADVFAVKIAQSGGLFAAGRVAAIAQAAGIGLYGGTMLEGAVGTIAAAHLFSTFPRLEWGTELFGPLLLTEEILTEPLDYSEFSLRVPTGPGLGITLDEERVSQFRRDKAERTVHSMPKRKTGT